MFVDAEFMSAKDKESVLRDWKAFVKALASSAPSHVALSKKFTNAIYKHLSLHCSFIAHYSRAGFFETYFRNGEDTVKFIQQFDSDFGYISVEYGADYWYHATDYVDLNAEMCKVVDEYKAAIYQRCQVDQEEADIAEAKRLLEKHGLFLLP